MSDLTRKASFQGHTKFSAQIHCVEFYPSETSPRTQVRQPGMTGLWQEGWQSCITNMPKMEKTIVGAIQRIISNWEWHNVELTAGDRNQLLVAGVRPTNHANYSRHEKMKNCFMPNKSVNAFLPANSNKQQPFRLLRVGEAKNHRWILPTGKGRWTDLSVQ